MKPVQDQETRHQFIPSQLLDDALASIGSGAGSIPAFDRSRAVQIHHQLHQFLHVARRLGSAVDSISPSKRSIDWSRCWNSGCADMLPRLIRSNQTSANDACQESCPRHRTCARRKGDRGRSSEPRA